MKTMELVPPQEKYLGSFHTALKEASLPKDLLEFRADYVDHMRDAAEGRNLYKGEVARSEFWLVDGEKYLDRVQIRHEPSGFYPTIKSHIYYEVRPSERRKGYGTMLFKMALAEAEKLGFKELIVSCQSSNGASRRIIEKMAVNFCARKLSPARRHSACTRLRFNRRQPMESYCSILTTIPLGIR